MPINDSEEWVGLPALDISRINVLYRRWRNFSSSYYDYAAASGINIAEPLPGRTSIGTANSIFAEADPEDDEVWPESGPDPADFMDHISGPFLYPNGGLVPIGTDISGDPQARSRVADLDWELSFLYACALTRMLQDLFHIRQRGRPRGS